MKSTTRQPICITKFKRKYSISGGGSQNGHTLDCQKATNCQTDRTQKSPRNKPSRAVLSLWENQSNKGTLQRHQNKEIDIGALQNKILKLQSQNAMLCMSNQQLKDRIKSQEIQKGKLCERIQQLQTNLQKFQQDFNAHLTSPPPPPPAPQPQTLAPTKHLSLSPSPSPLPRRYSLSHSLCPPSQPSPSENTLEMCLQTQIKEIKNLLEAEKVKNYGLKKQIQIAKENARVEVKIEMEALQRKTQQLKTTLLRKDKQIAQKQALIQKYIVNRQ